MTCTVARRYITSMFRGIKCFMVLEHKNRFIVSHNFQSTRLAVWIADLELIPPNDVCLLKVHRKICVCPKCRVLYIDQVLRLDFVLSRFFQGVVSMRLGEINALPMSTT